jgi:hypothetical protein
MSLDSEQWAWAAGLFDGEGSFYIQKQRRGEKTRCYPRIGMSNTDRSLLERFAAVVGAGRIYSYKQAMKSADGYKRKPLFILQINTRSDVERVVAGLKPWLSETKKEDAARALAGSPSLLV